ncbi:MAG: SRPBCC domain-containing protein [Caulobacterales bacterium]
MSSDELIVPPDVVYVTYIKASSERIWDALTSSEMAGKMFFGVTAESDWTQGAQWVYFRDGVKDVHGEVLISDKPRKLKLSWRVGGSPEMSAIPPAFITYDIEPVGDVTRLTMTQHQPKPIPRKFYEGGLRGWPVIMSILKSVLETGEGFVVTMEPPK